MYKIRLACTGKNEFSYKTKIIDKKNIDDIVNNLNLRTYQYVEKGNFLYKTNNRFTCKFMEIICNDKITLTAFKNFIKKLKKIGFYSEEDSRVDLIDIITNKVVYGYKFQSMTVIEDKKNKNNKKYKNSSIYATRKFFP
jgi:hypothetical protein